MTGILDKFHVEHGIHGARVMRARISSPPTASQRVKSIPRFVAQLAAELGAFKGSRVAQFSDTE